MGTQNETERQRWVRKMLSGLTAGSRILDAGAGEQQYRNYCSHLNYVSQDFCEYKGTGNDQGLQTGTWDISSIDIRSDIVAIPENDKSFDAILCTEVFEHIPDPIAALNEFHRLLKKGGVVILTAPFCSLTHFAPYHFYSGFNSYFFEYHLSRIGFSITEITPNGDWSEYEAQEIRRLLSIYGVPPFYIKILIYFILRFININRKKINTSDICCFGFHVRAVKK